MPLVPRSKRRMLRSRPALPGSLSPLAAAACRSWRAISGMGQPRAWRCWRSHAPSSWDIASAFTLRTWVDTVSVRAYVCLLFARPAAAGWENTGLRCWLAEEAVGLAGFGAFDEGLDLVGFEDEGGAVRVGGVAQGGAA